MTRKNLKGRSFWDYDRIQGFGRSADPRRLRNRKNGKTHETRQLDKSCQREITI